MRRNFESTYNFGSLMSGKRTLRTWCASAMLLASFALVCAHAAAPGQDPSSRRALSLEENTPESVAARNTGCMSCHTQTDSLSMHPTNTVHIACVDCHGGNGEVQVAKGTAPSSKDYTDAKNQAHVLPQAIQSNNGAAPVRAYTEWLKESPEYIRFVNPGDLRIADQTCGTSGCHVKEVQKVRMSMMTHGAMLWGAALYNNGAWPYKDPHFGESYGRDG